jgi:hypothetical protein
MKNTTSATEEETEVVSSAPADDELLDEPEELREIDEEDEEAEEASGSGAVAGAFGLTSLALALASLTGTWLSNAYQTRDSLLISEKTTISTTAQEYPIFASEWHTQGLFGIIFSLAALLVGAGVLTAPSLLLSGRTPAWARATALSGLIVGAIGLVLGLLTWFGVLTAQIH